MTTGTHDLEAAIRARSDALVTQDWALVEAQLHEHFTYTNSRGERLGPGRYLEFLRDGPLRWVCQSIEDMLVAQVGDTAAVTGIVFDHVVVDGEEHELHFATTQAYVRVDGEWKYLAGQTSPIDLG